MSKSKWQPNQDQQQLLQIVSTNGANYQRAQALAKKAFRQRTEAAAAARAGGCTWQAIADGLGCSPRSAKWAVRLLPYNILRKLNLDHRGDPLG